MINRITGQIFLGNGDHSLAQIGHLYQQLGKAITILGGIQQPPDPTVEGDVITDEERDDAEQDVEYIASEIFLALTGRRAR